ncbi:electron transport complex subunit RsxE [Candidatus Ishikawella capsulata]|nr:electron transport complex subunit RsxE [Candidatus Ishikawaella capsulata]
MMKNQCNSSCKKSNLFNLCPIIAVTSTVSNALVFGVIIMLITTINNMIISALRRCIPTDIRFPIYMIIISGIITCLQMLIHAYVYSIYKNIYFFLPLIIANCNIIREAETIAYTNEIIPAGLNGIKNSINIISEMFVLALVREIIANGIIFDNASQQFGSWATYLRIQVMHLNSPIIIAKLPAGGLMILGLLIALKNIAYQYIKNISEFMINKRILKVHE